MVASPVPFSLTRKERKILTVLLVLFLLGLLGMVVLGDSADVDPDNRREGFSRPVLPLSAQSRA